MAKKEPSLEKVLRGVPPETLDQPCQEEHLCEVARHITDWLILAPLLGISRAEDREIVGNWPRNTAKQKIEFLRKWQEKRGRKATYRRLCKTFIKVGELPLAEKVCDVLTGQGSSSSEGSEDEDSGLTPPPTKKQRPGSTTPPTETQRPCPSEVGGPHPPMDPIGSSPISPHPPAPPPPTGDDLLDTMSESRGSEPSTTLHPRPHPWTSMVTTRSPLRGSTPPQPHVISNPRPSPQPMSLALNSPPCFPVDHQALQLYHEHQQKQLQIQQLQQFDLRQREQQLQLQQLAAQRQMLQQRRHPILQNYSPQKMQHSIFQPTPFQLTAERSRAMLVHLQNTFQQQQQQKQQVLLPKQATAATQRQYLYQQTAMRHQPGMSLPTASPPGAHPGMPQYRRSPTMAMVSGAAGASSPKQSPQPQLMQAGPTRKLAHKPHPPPHLSPKPTLQPGGVVGLSGQNHMPKPLPVPPGGQFVQDVSRYVCHTAPPPPTEVHPLDPYSEYLRDMYDIIQPQSLVLQWPPPPTRRVFNLAMIHSTDIQCGPFNEELYSTTVAERQCCWLHTE